MSCPACEARRRMLRDALMQAKLKESLGHAVKGAAEIVGLKPKTAVVEQTESRRVSRKTPPNEGIENAQE